MADTAAMQVREGLGRRRQTLVVRPYPYLFRVAPQYRNELRPGVIVPIVPKAEQAV